MSATVDGPAMWRSLEELAGSPEAEAHLREEFPGLVARIEAGLDRRTALKFMGAALALTGLSGCEEPEEILPYVDQPEGLIPGRPRYFATTLLAEGYGIGAVVESHEGRPTKVEGNPDHPGSLGATDAVMQAACLDLFDPERSRLPLRNGQAASQAAVDLMLADLRGRLHAKAGAGVALLTGPVTSPSFHAGMEALRRDFPELRWYRHAPLGDGKVEVCGRQVVLRPVLSEAQTILSLDADFLGDGPGKLAHARGFAARRRVAAVPPESAEMPRLYAVESTPTITGAAADHRWAVRPSAVAAVARAVAATLDGRDPAPAPIPAEAVRAIAADLRAAGPAALVLAGAHLDPALQRLALAMNQALGALGRTIEALPAEAFGAGADGDLANFVAALQDGTIDAAVLIDINPVYTAPGDLDLAPALARAELAVHVGGHVDETAALCEWHVPAAHPLESWGDARAFDGTVSLLQPLIRPLYDGRTGVQILAALAGVVVPTARELIASYWADRGLSPLDWQLALKTGVIEGTRVEPVALDCGTLATALDALPPGDAEPPLELRIVPDPYLRDGAYATNAWLQELPRPLTKIVWMNAAALAPATAAELGIETGQIVELRVGDNRVAIPAWVQPGHPGSTVTVSLGHGRRLAGGIATGLGSDVYPLRSPGALWTRGAVEVRPTGARVDVINTQHHHGMAGRDVVRHATLDAYRENPDIIHAGHPPPPQESLYPEWDYPDHAWGMVIDLTACIGCNACVAACQAENNIPTVGPDECAFGREMHWLRVDRYYAGPPEAPRTFFQPVPCMHCEKAPCEVVCPVNATVHTKGGLNAQVYNRCIGTRYCSQNCPYKVRRFNFLLYQPFDADPAPTAPVMNPDVSVRSRGVMEKCTYCVQRIQEATIAADIERRPIRDGEIVTACQQACPTEAITFGDLNEAGSAVRRLHDDPLDYALLAHLNTRPRTTYLGRLSNPDPGLREDEEG